MANEFTYKAAAHQYGCGEEWFNLTVVRFFGPEGARACAYCCTMNIDIDGNPQAYGPLSTPNVTPIEFLENGGFMRPDQNAAVKRTWDAQGEQALNDYKDLLQQKADLDPNKVEQKKKDLDKKIPDAEKALKDLKQKQAAPDPKTDDKGKKTVDQQVASAEKLLNDLKQQLADLDPKKLKEKRDALDTKIDAAKWRIALPAKKGGLNNPYVFKDLKHGILLGPTDPKPKYLNEKFWHWYGCASLTPDDAKRTVWTVPGTGERLKPKLYHPDPAIKAYDPLINYDWYEDVNGTFPVVQVPPQPGPRYFVSVLSHRINTKFPLWDQRAFLPASMTTSQPYGALSTWLAGDANLALDDRVFALRLDSADSLTFPFLDTGFEKKVAECSLETFLQLGGTGSPRPGGGPPVFDNSFFVLYLAFPSSTGQSPSGVLSKFGKADNALDFPIILSFIAQATLDLGRPGRVSKNPLEEYKQWKRRPENQQIPPAAFNVIDVTLRDNGFVLP
jgi:hypothetical protein